MSGVCLTLKDVHISLHGNALLQVNTRIEPGASLTVMGPSGIGKSSLLAYVAGFLSSDFSASGEIFLGEHCLNALPAEQRGIGLLFQDPLLFPHLSVAQNLPFAVPRHVSHRQQQVDQALEAVGLQGFGDRDPATLSGGQKARVALQRLLLLGVQLGLQASYLNQPVQVARLRPKLQQLTGRPGYAQLLLRIGTPTQVKPAAPRRPLADVLVTVS
jgi:putative thiamine transport system ATP-binding protein